MRGWLTHGFVILHFDVGANVVEAAVADFDVVLVEELVVRMLLREVLRYEVEEALCHVGFYVLAVRGVEPDDVSRSFSSSSRVALSCIVRAVRDLLFVSAFFQRFIVVWCCVVEYFFVGGDVRDSFCNRIWDFFDDRWRVVAFNMYVRRGAVRFVVWSVRSAREVQR